MGRDEAAIRVPPTDPDASLTIDLNLAERTVQLLREVNHAAVEIGPGFSSLPNVQESPAGSEPLAASSAGPSELRRRGWSGPDLVVATDPPWLTSGMRGWLSEYAPGRSVVPVMTGKPQPLCTRYQSPYMDLPIGLTEAGKRAIFDLLDAPKPLYVPEHEWAAFSGDRGCLVDIDTPDQLRTDLRARQ